MKLYPSAPGQAGTWTSETHGTPGDNTIVLGQGKPHGTIQQWDLSGISGGLNLQDHHMVFTADIVFVNYWAAYSGLDADGREREAHVGVMQHARLESVPGPFQQPSALGKYGGHGPIFADLWKNGTTDPDAPLQKPAAMLETWGAGVVPANFEYIRKGSGSMTLLDNARYKVWAISTSFCNEAYSRYVMWRQNSRAQFDRNFDSKDYLDNNWGMDRTRESLALFDAGNADRAMDCEVRIYNPQVIYRPATMIYT